MSFITITLSFVKERDHAADGDHRAMARVCLRAVSATYHWMTWNFQRELALGAVAWSAATWRRSLAVTAAETTRAPPSIRHRIARPPGGSLLDARADHRHDPDRPPRHRARRVRRFGGTVGHHGFGRVLVVRDAWVRAADEGGLSAAYLTISNGQAADDALVGISAPAPRRRR